MSQLGLTPPSDLWDIFEFGTFLKNVDPPPSYQIGTFLNFRHYKGYIANYTIKQVRLSRATLEFQVKVLPSSGPS